ncbi:MAG: ABC transporter ATP-binding protein, partial [Clostridia bacterium]|nr:ABC transporter ATP-binding protein [Clostridia bacterium]
MPRESAKKGVLGRVLRTLFESYPVLAPVVAFGLVFSSVVSSIPALFQQRIIAIVEIYVDSGDWSAAKAEIMPLIVTLIVLYFFSISLMIAGQLILAYMTQGYLCKMRRKMFEHMQDLPIRYFDSHRAGDVMSYYTNDIDTLRQLVSQALPQIVRSGAILATILGIMIWYCGWLTILILLGVCAMIFVTKIFGGGSARYFKRQQQTMGKTEGYIQEMMNGQKVVKVFCREKESMAAFEKINGELCEDSFRANAYANCLAPIIGNIGNVLYVLTAIVGGTLLITGAPNFSLSGLPVSISIVVPFLNMAKQFTGNVNNLSQQVNAIVMGMAGAERIFALIDEEPETDEGYVTLVNAKTEADGSVTETEERTGRWAWKHPHGDGTVTYTPLAGDVRLFDVDFSYDGEKQVLTDVTVYAEPGQKVAFVGATGAGKTTITNLINRFYDIADGKIRYDGININKIKKADLRRSLGIVLQDTSLFTGTVLENIRYGRLDATDEECENAAKLVGADDFISRLPGGYGTELTGNGANLSQGQRQLIAIARAAVADPPVLIMDEA